MKNSKGMISYFYASSSSTSIMKAGLLVLFTVLVFLIAFLNVSVFKQIFTIPYSFIREMQYMTNGGSFNGFNSSSSPFLLRTDENTYVGAQGTQIFINCTCPNQVQSCTKEEEVVMASIKADENNDSKPDQFSILIGILTRADLYERRHFLRMIYGIQSTVHARVDVKFVLCNLTKDDQRILVPLEIMRYNDIIILNCEENMDNGKTYTYFSSLPKMGLQYDYVMKADDDVYFRIDKLAETMKPLPRNDTYYGFVVPCHSTDHFRNYMSGMGYALSWDLVEWIEGSPGVKNKTKGPEDKLVAEWLNEGKKAKNRFNSKPAMYEYPMPGARCSHELIPDTIAVHKLKNRDKWFDVIKFFNITSVLNESKLYHLY